MITHAQLRSLGKGPAVYCLYGGRRPRHVAYVGIAKTLQTRITQHLIRRDSSVTTGVSPVALNPDLVTAIAWWRHPALSELVRLQAAELIAFQVFDPVLRSRGGIKQAAEALARDNAFRSVIEPVFRGPPEGRLVLEDLGTVNARLHIVERRMNELERLIAARDRP